MTGQRISEFWKFAGKLVKLADIGAADASGIKTHIVNTVSQFGQQTGGGQELYDDLVTVVVPLQTRVQAVAGSLDRVPALVKASVESYLRAVAPELSQPATASPLALMTTLAAQMVSASGTITPSGRFWNYFRDGWGFSGFPASGSPTYPDSLITSVIV